MSDTTARPRVRRRVLGLDDQQRQAERRRLLLAAALELFGTRGYASTSIELLCQTAGIGTNSFYELFPGKEAVMIALYDQITAGLSEAIGDEYLAVHGSPSVIRAVVGRFVHESVDDPRVARVAFIEATGISDAVEERRRATRHSFVDGLLAIGQDLRRARSVPAEPPVRGPSPRRNAIALVGAVYETTIDWLLDPDPDPIEQLIDDLAYHCTRVVEAILDPPASD